MTLLNNIEDVFAFYIVTFRHQYKEYAIKKYFRRYLRIVRRYNLTTFVISWQRKHYQN